VAALKTWSHILVKDKKLIEIFNEIGYQLSFLLQRKHEDAKDIADE
jgi:hypothetical protein